MEFGIFTPELCVCNHNDLSRPSDYYQYTGHFLGAIEQAAHEPPVARAHLQASTRNFCERGTTRQRACLHDTYVEEQLNNVHAYMTRTWSNNNQCEDKTRRTTGDTK